MYQDEGTASTRNAKYVLGGVESSARAHAAEQLPAHDLALPDWSPCDQMNTELTPLSPPSPPHKIRLLPSPTILLSVSSEFTSTPASLWPALYSRPAAMRYHQHCGDLTPFSGCGELHMGPHLHPHPTPGRTKWSDLFLFIRGPHGCPYPSVYEVSVRKFGKE